MSFFSSGTSGPKKPFSSLPSVVSWFIRPVTTATGSAVQQLPLLTKFHEFVKHLCEIACVNNGQNHSLLFRKACLSFLIANQNKKNGTSKQIIAWMGKMTNDKAQNAIKVSSFNATMRKWLLHEQELASVDVEQAFQH